MKKRKTISISISDISNEKLEKKLRVSYSLKGLKFNLKAKDSGTRSNKLLDVIYSDPVGASLIANLLYELSKITIKKSQSYFQEEGKVLIGVVRMKSGVEIRIPAHLKKKKIDKIAAAIVQMGKIETVDYI